MCHQNRPFEKWSFERFLMSILSTVLGTHPNDDLRNPSDRTTEPVVTPFVPRTQGFSVGSVDLCTHTDLGPRWTHPDLECLYLRPWHPWLEQVPIGNTDSGVPGLISVPLVGPRTTMSIPETLNLGPTDQTVTPLGPRTRALRSDLIPGYPQPDRIPEWPNPDHVPRFRFNSRVKWGEGDTLPIEKVRHVQTPPH